MIDEPPTLKKNPRADYYGNWLTHNQETRITNRRFMDERRIAAKLHRHLTVIGRAGASGKYDPKTITLPDGTKYQPSDPPGSPCALCESGDMILPWKRFRDSKYKPSAWRCLWLRFRGKMVVMKAKATQGKTALHEFTRTMTALFRVPKSEVEDKPKPRKKTTEKPN